MGSGKHSQQQPAGVTRKINKTGKDEAEEIWTWYELLYNLIFLCFKNMFTRLGLHIMIFNRAQCQLMQRCFTCTDDVKYVPVSFVEVKFFYA